MSEKMFVLLLSYCLLKINLSLQQNAGESWVQIGGDINGEAAGDESGTSVSLSDDGSVVAVGAPYNDGNGRISGHVSVYVNNGDSWVQVGKYINGEAAEDKSGYSVSLSDDGSVVAVGAPYNDGNGIRSGHVSVYRNDGGSWVQIGGDIDSEAAGDKSGFSVSLSDDGSVVAVGAIWNGQDAGHVRVYRNDGDDWVQIGEDIDGEAAEDMSGVSVSLSDDGSVVAVGAPFNDGNGLTAGHVRVYRNDGDSWVQVGEDIDGEAAEDWNGYSVSLSADGSVVAVGAPYNDGNGKRSGHVRVYMNNGDSWVQVGEDIDGEAAGDESGYSVSLSDDGSVVAVGAPYNHGNGKDSGHVRVYRNDDDIWVQVGEDIDGEAAWDMIGISVSLSTDGSVVAVGAPYNDGNGHNAGHTRVFHIVSTVNGEWGDWSDWSVCTSDCTGGTQERSRKCDNPPVEGNGLDCVGEASQTMNCNEGIVCTGEFRLVDNAGRRITLPNKLGLLLYRGGTICDNFFSDYSANAICRLMGFRRGAIDWKGGYRGFSKVQRGKRITLTGVRCGSSNSWSSCRYSTVTGNCSHREDVFVECR